MTIVAKLISYGCILAAAAIVGNWFLAELRKAKAARLPWYSAYLSPPGILILIIVILLPIIASLLKSSI